MLLRRWGALQDNLVLSTELKMTEANASVGLLLSQSALKQAISNRKTMKNHIAQKTTEDVFLSFVIYQGDILIVLSCSMLVFKKCYSFTARVQTQEISTDF